MLNTDSLDVQNDHCLRSCSQMKLKNKSDKLPMANFGILLYITWIHASGCACECALCGLSWLGSEYCDSGTTAPRIE